MKNIRRICWFLIVLCTATVLISSVNVYAATKKYGFEGYGTQYDPYLITSYEDICELRDIVDNGDNLSRIYFRQTTDILFPEGEMWNPIGDLLSGFAFSGYYNGSGHTISNIYCEDQYAGLFSFLGGEVRNLGIESGTFSGSCAGSITSHGTDAARVVNCYNKADVAADGRAGGITDNFPGIIMFCWNMGNVQGLSADVPTAGICSYGSAQIAYCYDMNTGKLVDDSTFSGNITESTVFSKETVESVMDLMYEGMWDIYSGDYEPDSIKALVAMNRGNTVFMRWKAETIVFDPSYEPVLFSLEKEENKEAFLTIYNTRFDFEGSGTEADPFQIATYEDLSRLRDCVDIGVTYRDYCFEQTADIYFPDGEIWNPIGDLKALKPFRGTYDGNGHCLYDINCDDQYAGLFSYLNGEVRNLGIESGRFTGSTVGSITSHGGTSARIINCYNKAEVIGDDRAGGLADNCPGFILFSWNLGAVSGTREETVIAGISSYGSADIEYCYSTSGNSAVNIATYSGTLINSGLVGSEDIATILQDSYQKYADYISAKMIDPDKLVFLISEGQDLSFDASYVPAEIDRLALMTYLPEFVLACFGVVFGAVALVAVSKRSDTKRIDKEKTTKQTDEATAKKIITKEIYMNRGITVILTSVIFISCFHGVMDVLNAEYTAGILNLEYWEKDENENADILFLGSSTMSVNIELAELWQRYGIAAYCLGAGGMTMYDSYYRLIEAEKSHHTEMVVIDARACVHTSEYAAYEMQTENVSGLKWSLNKLNFVRAAVALEERPYFFLEFPLYHNRYNSVTKWDFLHTSSLGEDDKGTWTVFYGNRYSPKLESAKDITTYRAFDEKAEYYFRKVIEYCQENDIELLVIKTPDADREINQTIYNTVGMITEEYGIPYLDFNLHDEEIGLAASDFYYDTNHLNVIGARKCSDFLGEYLVSHYDLTDHRGDDVYVSWERFASNREDLYLRAITDREDYFAELRRDNKHVTAVFYKLPEASSAEYLALLEQLETIQYSEWTETDILYGEDNAETLLLGENRIEITKLYSNCVFNINTEKEMVVSGPGVVLLVYDEITGEIADVVVFTSASGYVLTRLYYL